MKLAGDVGGTKTILALYSTENDRSACIKKQVYASQDYQTFTELLADFLSEDVSNPITSVCIGVAGPIVDGDCVTTNLPWVMRRNEIGAGAGTENVRLLNDLEATAWGLLNSTDKDFVDLNPDGQNRHGNIAVLAAGTGLGEAMIVWDGNAHHVIATEGGHADFAPANDQEIGLLKYLWQRYPGHVSCERLLSGVGLVSIYRYLEKAGCAPADQAIEQQMRERDPAAVIGEAGVDGADPLSVAALTLFCRLYGAEAGNLALKCLPYGGVYLAGGIAAKILPFLTGGDFMQGFLAKGRYRPVLQQIPVKVCINTEIALWGTMCYGSEKSKN